LKSLVAILLALIALPAWAENPVLTCVPPTTYADNLTPIPAGTAIGYNFYGAMQGSPLVLLNTAGPLPTCSDMRTNVNVGTICYSLAAVVNGQESAQEPPICIVVPPPPGTPGSFNANPTTTSTIAYMIVAGTDTYSPLIVGSVPLGTPCNANERLLNLNVIPRAAVTFTGALKPVAVLGSCL
jgi:hypothetical protein